MPSTTITIDGVTITIDREGTPDNPQPVAVEVPAPPAPAPRVYPLNVSDTGPSGQKMTNRNPLWRAFRDPDLGAAVREALAAALDEGGSTVTEFLDDAERLVFARLTGTAADAATDHLIAVGDGLADDHANTDWIEDTGHVILVSTASAVVMASRSGFTVPPILLAIATDILRAYQRGYVVVNLVGYRPFVARRKG